VVGVDAVVHLNALEADATFQIDPLTLEYVVRVERRRR